MSQVKDKVFTIGYEKIDFPKWLSIIGESNIEVIIDVRERPLSRKKGFSKTRMAETLREHRIEYVHLRQLGSPPELRNELKRSGDFEVFFNQFNSLLDEEERQVVLQTLIETVEVKTCCLICVEEDPDLCHRSRIAEYLEQLANGRLKVEHIRYLQPA